MPTQQQTEHELRQEIKQYIYNRLGGGMVDVELDQEHYDTAISQALSKYRQRSSNAMEESYGVLKLVPEQNVYVLPQEVMSVRQIFRRGLGNSQSTSNFEPFSAGWMNAYMLQSGRQGGLVMYELYASFQELAMRMFGGFINFTFDPQTKKLTIMRKIPLSAEEDVILWQYNYKPDAVLLADHAAGQWIKEYAYSFAKFILGEARSKFNSIAGPQGGTSLNGNDLKNEATKEMELLLEELKKYQDWQTPMWFVIG